MKLWGEMTKQELLEILEAILDGKKVEAYCLAYNRNGKLTRQWQDSSMSFFYDDVSVRIKDQ